MIKRYIALSIVVLLTITACSSNTVDLPQGTLQGKITYLATGSPSEDSPEEKLARQLEEINPRLQIVIERYPYYEYQRELMRRFNEGNPPDLFYMWGNQAEHYNEQGHLADLSFWFNNNRSSFEEYFDPAIADMALLEGIPSVVPMSTDIIEVVYRTFSRLTI